MPNLLPPWDFVGWFHPAGRLIWSVILTFAGLAFVFALMRPPVLKRPFPTRVGLAIFFVIPVVGWIIAGLIPDDANISDWPVDALIVDIVLLALFAHALLMVLSRAPRDPEISSTWVECFLGALGTFAIMALAYAVVPHEWLTYANSYLKWGDSTKFLFRSNQDMLFFPWHWPFNMDYPALRDVVVTGIYVVFLGLNLFLFAKWQTRRRVPTEVTVETEGTPARRSRFGRPLRRWTPRAAEAASGTTTPVSEGV
jgi:hypothetical protein